MLPLEALMKVSNLLFIASWVILLVVSGAIILLSAQSVRIAYTGAQDSLTPEFTLTHIEEQGGAQAVKAFRGRRATAATWAFGYAVLAIGVIWIPYRRAEKWAWWALFVSLGLSQFLSLGRAIMLGATAGTATPAILLAFVLLGLLAGAPRIFGNGRTELEK
jgi:hypothetical protein